MGLGYEKSLCYCDDHLHNLFAMVLKATTRSSLIIHFVILDKSHNYNHVNDLGELESFFPCVFFRYRRKRVYTSVWIKTSIFKFTSISH